MISITKRRLASLASASVIIATMAVASVPAAAMAAGPVFVNGGFELGDYTPIQQYDLETLSTGSSHLTGWTVSGSVDWTGSGVWNASQGTKSMDLEGAENATGALSQTFATNPGSTYVVTFDMSGNTYMHQGIKTMTVAATGGATSSYTVDTTGGDVTLPLALTWVPQTYTFVASSDSTTLTFASATSSGYGPALDNVVVTETLKTGADCKKGGWQGMVDLNGTHFRNQGDCVSYYATGEKNLAN